MSYKEYASKGFVDELYLKKSDVPSQIYDFLTLRDKSTGYHYYVYMKDGALATSPKITEIKVTKAPDKVNYMQGEKLDLTGIEVVAVIESGDCVIIEGYKTDEYAVNSIINVSYTDEFSGESFITSFEVELSEFDPSIHLIDFDYTDNGDGTYTLTGWKQTFNGEPSTELIIPDNAMIIL